MAAANQRRNPYIIGRPIDEEEFFFGREGLFGFIEDNLLQDVKVILLHGQRRIGKSSVLRHIPLFFQHREFNEFVFVNFDLQDKASLPLSHILHSLATEMLDHLEWLEHLDTENSLRSLLSATELEPDIFSHKFLPQVYQELGDKKLVLLLDEFDVLSDDVPTQGEESQADMHFFAYLKELIEQHKKLFIIPVVGRNLSDMPKLLNLFGYAPVNEIGLLDEVSARRLISNPARDILRYDQDAIKAILDLSAGHPYFTQVICYALFQQAREQNNSQVTRDDVDSIVTKAIESAEGGLDWYWKGLPTQEQVVFSAVAEAQRIVIANNQFPEDPLVLLKNYGVQTESLNQAANQLRGANNNNSFLDDTGRRVKVELVRRWLIIRHPLRQVILKLEKLEQEEINPLLEQAEALRQKGETKKVLAVYEWILQLNPNHFSTVVNLAQGYLEVNEFDKAVELYTRSYQVNPARHKDGLLHALTTYGDNLFKQQEWVKAREQFNRILEIERGNQLAEKKLQEISNIEASATQPPLLPGLPGEWIIPHLRLRIPLLYTAAVIGITTLTIISVYRVSTPCPPGQQKVFFVGCKLDERKISRGERTFFPNIKNPARDQGIQAFQESKYSEAAKFFKRAVAINRSDPEVLIYYNNARARQQQNPPYTLAAVVPADNTNIAQEILRGVAQAQNQFNEKGGLNGRLLEIVIANDSNNPETAKQVAQKLVNDKSVLGVIGHTSSEPTQAALPQYEKAKLAIISPTSTNPLLSSDVFFRTVPSNAAIGKRLAEYTTKSLGLNKVVIFFVFDSLYSNSLREEFTKNFELLGGQVVGRIDLTNSKLNPTAEVARSVYAKEYRAQAVVLFPDTQSTSIALDVAAAVAQRNVKLKNSDWQGVKELKLLGGDTLYSNTTLEKRGNDIKGIILAVPWFWDAPQSQIFAQAAAQQWGRPIGWRTATSFDATQAFIKALSSPNLSRSTVLQRLHAPNFTVTETSGKLLQFTQDGDSQSQPILVKVVGGTFETVKE